MALGAGTVAGLLHLEPKANLPTVVWGVGYRVWGLGREAKRKPHFIHGVFTCVKTYSYFRGRIPSEFPVLFAHISCPQQSCRMKWGSQEAKYEQKAYFRG